MGRTLKDLALALINATLILLALCLFLGLRVVDRANDVAATFAASLADLGPVRNSLDAMTTEVAAMRTDFRMSTGAGAQEQLAARAAALETRLDEIQASIAHAQTLPYDLIDHAIAQTGEEISARIHPLIPEKQAK